MVYILSEIQFQKLWNIVLSEQMKMKKFIPIPMDKIPIIPPFDRKYMEGLTKKYNDFYTNLEASGKLGNDDFYDAFYHYMLDQLPKKENIESGWIKVVPSKTDPNDIDYYFLGGEKNSPPPLTQKEINRGYKLKWEDKYIIKEVPSLQKEIRDAIYELAEIQRKLKQQGPSYKN